MDILAEIFSLQDKKFCEFNAKLIPNIEKSAVIGVKTPELKKLAKRIVKCGQSDTFLHALPHKYFEENQLHAFIISEIRDYDIAISELERFLPYIDNWATCDQLILKTVAKNPERIMDKVNIWLKSGHTYTVRFAIGIYMRYFLDERFDEKYLDIIASIKSDEYYVNMMLAWYFASALAKQYDKTLPLFLEKKLDKWVHNKSISKTRESYRVSDQHKEELKKLKIK